MSEIDWQKAFSASSRIVDALVIRVQAVLDEWEQSPHPGGRDAYQKLGGVLDDYWNGRLLPEEQA